MDTGGFDPLAAGVGRRGSGGGVLLGHLCAAVRPDALYPRPAPGWWLCCWSISAWAWSLAALIAWRLVRLWAERKSGRAGARLHVRLVTWFSLIAVVPAILVAVFASVTLNLGLDAMFSGQVQDGAGQRRQCRPGLCQGT